MGKNRELGEKDGTVLTVLVLVACFNSELVNKTKPAVGYFRVSKADRGIKTLHGLFSGHVSTVLSRNLMWWKNITYFKDLITSS